MATVTPSVPAPVVIPPPMPPSLTFSRPGNSRVLSRKRRLCHPSVTQIVATASSGPNQYVDFTLPTNTWFDLSTITFSFRVTVSGFTAFTPATGLGAVLRYASSAHDLWNRRHILQNGTLTDVVEFNTAKGVEYSWAVPESYQRDIGMNCEGVAPMTLYTAVTPDPNDPGRPGVHGTYPLAACALSNMFTFPGDVKHHELLLTEDMFQVYRLFPGQRSNKTTVRYYMETAARALVLRYGQILPSGITITVDDMQLNYDEIMLPDDLNNTVMGVIADNAFYIYFTTMSSSQQTTNQLTDFKTFNQKAVSLKGWFAYPQLVAAQNLATASNFGDAHGADFKSLWWKVANVPYPESAIMNLDNMFLQAVKLWGFFHTPFTPGKQSTASCWRLYASTNNYDTMQTAIDYQEEPYRSFFTNCQDATRPGISWTMSSDEEPVGLGFTAPSRNKFLPCISFEREWIPGAMTGIDLNSQQTPIDFMFQRDSADPLVLYAFSIYDMRLKLGSDGNLTTAQ